MLATNKGRKQQEKMRKSEEVTVLESNKQIGRMLAKKNPRKQSAIDQERMRKMQARQFLE